jgi:23S rRNA pseudoU1915 N3-methylase RlmH
MGWITSNIIIQYFSEPLHKKLEAYCKKENQNVKILLIIDNCTGHPRALTDLSETSKLAFSHLTQPHYSI